MSGSDGAAVLLPLSDDHFFDLREVMAAAGDWSHLQWELRDAWFNGDVRPVWPAGPEHAEAESETPAGLTTTWAEMRRLAASCKQVVNGRFTGYDAEGEPRLQFSVLDSTFWLIWSREAAVLDHMRTAFASAEPYDQPTPERLRTT